MLSALQVQGLQNVIAQPFYIILLLRCILLTWDRYNSFCEQGSFKSVKYNFALYKGRAGTVNLKCLFLPFFTKSCLTKHRVAYSFCKLCHFWLLSLMQFLFIRSFQPGFWKEKDAPLQTADSLCRTPYGKVSSMRAYAIKQYEPPSSTWFEVTNYLAKSFRGF